jgi:hypothetical protein
MTIVPLVALLKLVRSRKQRFAAKGQSDVGPVGGIELLRKRNDSHFLKQFNTMG